MIPSLNLHWIAAMVFERMVYCLAEGTALAVVVAAVLRVIPGKNSRTRFAVWLAALAAMALFPVIPTGTEIAKGTGLSTSNSSHALLTLSSTWAEYIVLAWAALAGLGLSRVAVGLWQIRRLRRGCVAIDPRFLGPELQAIIEESRKRRQVSVLVSSHLDVPTAVGFLRPAILVPAWLADGSRMEELKYVLLHELAHLQRWDDWTNLAQKLVKAVLFFHPGIWWIERNLSLDREMACDDAVLARTSNPRVYAQCLARVAEKSFLQRQITLAQAAVNRVRQLTLRVKAILEGDRPRSTLLWKPAIPMVAAIAFLSVISISTTPDLVRVSDGHRAMPPASALRASTVGAVINRSAEAITGKNAAPLVNMAKFTPASATPEAGMNEARVNPRPANLKPQPRHNPFVLARSMLSRNAVRQTGGASSAMVMESSRVGSAGASVQTSDSEHEDRQNGVILLVVANERISPTGAITWQVNMWELRLPARANHPAKPIPRKT